MYVTGDNEKYQRFVDKDGNIYYIKIQAKVDDSKAAKPNVITTTSQSVNNLITTLPAQTQKISTTTIPIQTQITTSSTQKPVVSTVSVSSQTSSPSIQKIQNFKFTTDQLSLNSQQNAVMYNGELYYKFQRQDPCVSKIDVKYEDLDNIILQ